MRREGNASSLGARADPDYVVIGNVSLDRRGASERLGGTALYASVAALRLGRRVGIVTACAVDLPFPPETRGASIVRLPSERTCTFIHTRPHDSSGRDLYLVERASAIDPTDIPPRWLDARIVHLAPIMGEVNPQLARQCRAPMIGATAQGWLRDTERDTGRVVSAPHDLGWAEVDQISTAVLSIEDIAGDERAGELLGCRIPILVITRGEDGCTIFVEGLRTDLSSYPAHELDSTGAGDVFAATFFVRLEETGDPRASAQFAACAAALSIEGVGVTRIPDRSRVEARLHAAG